LTDLVRLLMQDPQFRRKLGSRIKQLRKNHGWTQKELANMIGVRFQLLNKYESGETSPSIERLPGLAKALETTVDYLLTGIVDAETELHDKALIEMFRELEKFDRKDRNLAVEFIDALIIKRKVQRMTRA